MDASPIRVSIAGRMMFKRVMEKRYSVKFVIKNEKLKNSSFTGTFTNQRLEKILEYFKVSSKIRWKHINDDKDGSDRKKEIIEIY
jgi:hypothetical protein